MATKRIRVSAPPALLLFMSVFTSQAAVLVLSPILVDVARDLDVSTAAAGQLRVFAAPVALVVAVLVARSGGRFPLRSLLSVGAGLVALGSLASAAAPSFVVLALAQVPLWIGVAVLVAGGIGEAGSWSAPEARSRVVARALAGAPAAWIVGMPVIGLVAGINWRLAFLVVPLPAAVATGAVLLASRPDGAARRSDASLTRLLRQSGARGWAVSELLAMSSWTGTLVFSGALFIEAYGASPRMTGLFLAVVALAHLGGNVLGGRIRPDCLRRVLARANVAAARTVVGTAYGFVLAGERKLEIGAARAAVTHAGYLAGSFVGGAALAVGGRAAVGATFGLLFLGPSAPYVSAWTARCRPGDAARALASRRPLPAA